MVGHILEGRKWIEWIYFRGIAARGQMGISLIGDA